MDSDFNVCGRLATSASDGITIAPVNLLAGISFRTQLASAPRFFRYLETTDGIVEFDVQPANGLFSVNRTVPFSGV